MEQERERRQSATKRINERKRRSKKGEREIERVRGRAREREKRKQEPVEEPYFARSSAGVQILNRILDECISLTRLRPVSTGLRLLEEEETTKDGYDEEERKGRSQRDNKSVLSSATMGRMEKTERRV